MRKNVDRGPIVQTTAGRLWGIWESDLAVFRGIPYAAAPVGERRWRATESHPGWMGVREATVHGPIAPQSVGLPHDEVLDPVLGRGLLDAPALEPWHRRCA